MLIKVNGHAVDADDYQPGAVRFANTGRCPVVGEHQHVSPSEITPFRFKFTTSKQARQLRDALSVVVSVFEVDGGLQRIVCDGCSLSVTEDGTYEVRFDAILIELRSQETN